MMLTELVRHILYLVSNSKANLFWKHPEIIFHEQSGHHLAISRWHIKLTLTGPQRRWEMGCLEGQLGLRWGGREGCFSWSRSSSTIIMCLCDRCFIYTFHLYGEVCGETVRHRAPLRPPGALTEEEPGLSGDRDWVGTWALFGRRWGATEGCREEMWGCCWLLGEILWDLPRCTWEMSGCGGVRRGRRAGKCSLGWGSHFPGVPWRGGAWVFGWRWPPLTQLGEGLAAGNALRLQQASQNTFHSECWGHSGTCGWDRPTVDCVVCMGCRPRLPHGWCGTWGLVLVSSLCCGQGLN